MLKKIIDRLCIDRNKDNNKDKDKDIPEKEPDICEYTVEEKLKGYDEVKDMRQLARELWEKRRIKQHEETED